MTYIQLTTEPYLKKEELTCKCGCNRFNYDKNFLIKWIALRITFGYAIAITSGGRCVKHNQAEGGVTKSLHECETKKATATDCTSQKNDLLYVTACTCGLFNEVEWHKRDGKDFLHIGCDPKQVGNAFRII